MERYKKRIVALTLASLVTIAGSFANSNYKNSLTGLRLENTPTGDVRLVLQTRTAYQGSITPVRRDANTYILTLPEVKSEADIPDLQNVYGNVESVTIRTMPYSNSAKGYTRITLKTNQQSLKLLTTNQVYIPKNINKNTNMNTQNVTQNRSVDNSRIRQQINEEIAKKTAVEEIEQQESEATPTYQSIKLEPVTPSEEPVVVVETKSSENLFILLWSILLVVACAFFYVRANNKMRELAGFGSNDDDKDIFSQKLSDKIKYTVNKIDKAYPQGSSLSKTRGYANAAVNISKNTNFDPSNVIDLDSLFESQKTKKSQTIEEENSALEDFLSGFSFDEEFGDNAEELNNEQIGFDEELFEKIINQESIVFSKNDISCINKLLNNEVLDSTLDNVKKYVISNPVSTEFSKRKFIEEMILTYTLNQGVIFKANDVEILKKLMSVELDSDFITDLRTNSRRTIEMQTAILLDENNLKKPAEIKTLGVKDDDLPNLSEALKKQGNKKILSEYKPSATYYNTNCEVKTLSVGKEVKDLALELYKDDLFKYKPSAKYEIVDNNYSIGDNAIKFSLNSPKTIQKKKKTEASSNNNSVKNILNRQDKEKRQERIEKIKNNVVEKSMTNIVNCLIDGESMKIVSSVKFEENKGCYLAKKEDGYLVLGYIKDKLIKIKSYSELKSEKIQARKNEELPDGTLRFIVRIGLNKFVVDLKENEIKYVMDLC